MCLCDANEVQTSVFRKPKVLHHDLGQLPRSTELELNALLPVTLVDGAREKVTLERGK